MPNSQYQCGAFVFACGRLLCVSAPGVESEISIRGEEEGSSSFLALDSHSSLAHTPETSNRS